MGWLYLSVFYALSLAACSVGFRKYVYFLSVGYGFAIAAIGFGIMAVTSSTMHLVNYLQCLLLMLYGARLSGFLIYRERKAAAYRKTLAEATSDEDRMSVWIKAAIWVSVAALYVGQASPVFFRIYNGRPDTPLAWAGVLISAAALWLESEADREKSAQKRTRPDMVAMQGLYRLVRCPNYLGEILFWTGVLVGGLDILQGTGQWLMSVLSWIAITAIMFGGARRLEKRQEGRYGAKEEYRRYADHTPILIPWVPLYHLIPIQRKDS